MDGETRLLLSHLSPEQKKKIKASLKGLSADPYCGDELLEDLTGYYRYRVGRLRIVYSIERALKKVHIIAIGPRKTIYEDLQRELILAKPGRED